MTGTSGNLFLAYARTHLLHVLVLGGEVGDLPGELVADGLAPEDGLPGGLAVGQHAPQPLRLLLGLRAAGQR